MAGWRVVPNPLGCPPIRTQPAAGPPPPAAAAEGVCTPRAPQVTPPSAAQTGATALMEAASNGHLEVVKQLLEAGANTDKQDNVRPQGTAGAAARQGGAARGARPGCAAAAAAVLVGGGVCGLRGVRFSGCGNAGTPRGSADAGNCGASDALVGAAGRAALAVLVPALLGTNVRIDCAMPPLRLAGRGAVRRVRERQAHHLGVLHTVGAAWVGLTVCFQLHAMRADGVEHPKAPRSLLPWATPLQCLLQTSSAAARLTPLPRCRPQDGKTAADYGNDAIKATINATTTAGQLQRKARPFSQPNPTQPMSACSDRLRLK